MPTSPAIFLTGASSGLGWGTAQALAQAGARLWLLVRDPVAAAPLQARLQALAGHAEVHLLPGDLASQASLQACCDRLHRQGQQFDALALMAGVTYPRFARTADGIERNFAVNVLGSRLLLDRLSPLLSPQGRWVQVSGESHRQGKVFWEDPEMAQGFHWMEMARQCALMRATLALAQARYWEGSGRMAHTFCPGYTRSRLTRHLPPPIQAMAWLSQPFARSPLRAGTEAARLLLDPAFGRPPARYLRSGKVTAPHPLTQDPEVQDRLWALCTRYLRPAPGNPQKS